MSPVPARRAAAPAAPVVEGVDFLSRASSLYTGSFTLPAGDWAIWFDLMLQQPKEGSTYSNPRLGVRLSCVALDRPDDTPVEQFLSMGRKAHESFMPSEDGKSLVPVVGGQGNLTNKSNWSLFRDSLYNAGLDEGIISNDFSVLDGIWVTTSQEAEPEERKTFGGAETGEVQQANRGNGKIPVVIAIIEGGKPWEGGGGMPAAAPAAPAAPKGRPAPARAAAPAPKAAPARTAPARAAAPAPAAVEAEAGDSEDVTTVAVSALGEVLGEERYAAGIPKLILKTSVFKLIEKGSGKEMANAVTEAYFKTDALMVGLLEQIGYTLVGTTVKPAAA